MTVSALAQLKAEAQNFPDLPGVYVFKDEQGNIIYVGKAKSLKERIKSYFSHGTGFKELQLVSQAKALDFFVTENEVEALILECNLIKQHRPKFNIDYRDDKSYPYISISVSDIWPRLKPTREKHRAGVRYFGPYPNVQALRQTVDTLLNIFPLRSCSESIFKQAQRSNRPCLYYHVKRCVGPCIQAVSENNYRQLVNEVIAFLEGRQEQVVLNLKKQMQAAAERLQFEKAAALRDKIKAATLILEKQRVASDTKLNQDIFGLAEEQGIVGVQILKVRNGKLIGANEYFVKMELNSLKEALNSFIKQHYFNLETDFPSEIILPVKLADADLIASWLTAKAKKKIKVTVPSRGLKKSLLQMATANAAFALSRYVVRSGYEEQKRKQALEELQQHLGLKKLPLVIEAYDISTIFGQHSVGSLVVFVSGQPAPAAYRRFKIKYSQDQKPNDVAMLKEVLQRRLQPSRDDIFKHWPDLILVDGGKPQLTAALEVLNGLNINLPVIALAKQKEEVYLANKQKAVALSPNSAGSLLLQQIRDEAHRFALKYHRHLRDAVPNIKSKS